MWRFIAVKAQGILVMKNLKLFVVLSIALLTRLVSAKSYESWPVPVGPLCEMTYTPQATHFSLWSPKAEAVRVHLYAEGQGGMPLKTYDIPVMASDGTWGLTVEQELHGQVKQLLQLKEKKIGIQLLSLQKKLKDF